MKYNKEIIATRIKQRRKALNKTQKQIVEEMEEGKRIDVKTLIQLENGKSTPRLENLLALCEPLQCELGYLIGEYDLPTRVTTDIYKETGLTQESIEILKNEIQNAKYIQNKWKKNQPIQECHTTTTQFVNDFITNCAPVIRSIDTILGHLKALKELEGNEYYPLVKQLFEEEYDSTDWRLFGTSQKEKQFYNRLEDMLTELLVESDEAKESYENRRKEIMDMLKSGAILMGNTPDTAKPYPPEMYMEIIEKMVSYPNVSEYMDAHFQNAYELLKRGDNFKFEEFEISDTFLDMVKDFIKKKM